MSDAQPAKSNLNDISHLFLSNVRRQAGGDAPPPRRQPPKNDVSLDLTPDEFARMLAPSSLNAAEAAGPVIPPITLLLAGHLNGSQSKRLHDYARWRSSVESKRVGLIELDGSELRITCFEQSPAGPDDHDSPLECSDERSCLAALRELSWDMGQWLVVITPARGPEYQRLTALVRQWKLLCTCDHDGIVSGYRTLKGMTQAGRHRLSLALLDAENPVQAGRVHRKLAGVCAQFLDCALEADEPVAPAQAKALRVMRCRPASGEPNGACNALRQLLEQAAAAQDAALPTPPADDAAAATLDPAEEKHLQSAERLIAPPPAARPPAPRRNAEQREEEQYADAPRDDAPRDDAPRDDAPRAAAQHAEARTIASRQQPEDLSSDRNPMPAPTAPRRLADAAAVSITNAEQPEMEATILELPAGATARQAILEAALQHWASELTDSGLTPPGCPSIRLTISRRRQWVLVALVPDTGWQQLAEAVRWINDNRKLLTLALPHFSIAAAAAVQLRLLAAHGGHDAAQLQPLLQAGMVQWHTYRTVRWGNLRGLLVEQA